MTCQYCDSRVDTVPENYICPFCGAPLPRQSGSDWASRITQPAPQNPPAPQVVYQVPLQPSINCCGRCMSRDITFRKRGFSWGWGIFWFFMIPVFGIFLGFVGSGKVIGRCRSCGHKWRR